MQTPVTVKIKFKSNTVDQFIERYAVDISKGGIFVRTPKPLSVGTALRFEFQLQDGSPLLSGKGTVVWIRESDVRSAGASPGMGVRFDELPDNSQQVLERVLKQKERAEEFSDQPTKVVLDQAERAFDDIEEELARQAAERHAAEQQVPDGGDGVSRTPPPAEPEAEAKEPEPEAKPEAEPEAKEPEPEAKPEAEPEAKEPEPEAKPEPAPEPAAAAASPQDRQAKLEQILFSEEEAKEPEPLGAKPLTETPKPKDEPRMTEPRPSPVEEQKSSGVVWILILVAIGAAAFVWWKYFGPGAAPEKTTPPPAPGAAAPVEPAKPAEPAEPAEPAKPTVSMTVNSEPAGAKLIVDGADTGKVTPAELPGLDPEQEIEIVLDLAGRKLHRAKLKPTPDAPYAATLEEAKRKVQATSQPEGAIVLVDRRRVGKTPAELTKRLRPGKVHTVTFRLAGHEETEIKVALEDLTWTREGDDELATVSAALVKKAEKPAAERPRRRVRRRRPPKPDEAKPDEAKPDEAKPDEAKPDEAKPDEAKPDEAKPDEPAADDSVSDHIPGAPAPTPPAKGPAEKKPGEKIKKPNWM